MDSDFGRWDVLISMFWFLLLVTWVWMIIAIFADLFRDRETSGGGKAMWILFIVVVPWLGALAYLVFRGGSMHERNAHAAERLGRLGELRDGGAITAADYEGAKAKVLA